MLFKTANMRALYAKCRQKAHKKRLDTQFSDKLSGNAPKISKLVAKKISDLLPVRVRWPRAELSIFMIASGIHGAGFGGLYMADSGPVMG